RIAPEFMIDVLAQKGPADYIDAVTGIFLFELGGDGAVIGNSHADAFQAIGLKGLKKSERRGGGFYAGSLLNLPRKNPVLLQTQPTGRCAVPNYYIRFAIRKQIGCCEHG